MKSARFLSLIVGALAIGTASVAMARVDIGVNIGVPAPVYVAPPPVYAPPPPPVVYPPPAYAAPVYAPPVFIGWHGNRYWDGRRYWRREEWQREKWRRDRGRHHHHGRDW